jgi:hypothetical protein
MERYDILQPLTLADAPSFTVDTTAGVLNVGVTQLNASVLCNGDLKTIFAKGDSFILATFGLIMPLGFQIDRSSTVLQPRIRICYFARGSLSTHIYTFKEIGKGTPPASPADFSYLYGIMENYDTPADIYINVLNQQPAFVGGTLLKNEPFYLEAKLDVTDLKVSMVGVPSTLNTTVQRIFPYVKVYHNSALT